MAINVHEIFSSVQGEGLFSGCRHLFLRLSGCNLRCMYCDTRVSFYPPAKASVSYPGSSDPEMVANPFTKEKLFQILAAMKPERHHSLSITGGEPLMQPMAVMEAAEHWQDNGGRVLLETNGTLLDAFRKVSHAIDIVSMDIKLPPAVSATVWRTQQEFLATAAEACSSVYVKMVITPEVTLGLLKDIANMVAAVDCSIPVILQPVTSENGDIYWHEMLDYYQWELADMLTEVRILPQLHKLMGVR
ncbi:7-carboxy-7-deazaguanine synthase QueE [Metallumcola ferriviriculae]|uniref:7-carboxy-7-deazaguanine synthase n=1 Tax=Metallumcola ferriviriculae TaxID=3039180 RepID=A0AAU0UNS6_9FIRM|nr:7-carboxy-7-deazaguanine synthase QueE [Desulfitibacteraceae bacterium MK1]